MGSSIAGAGLTPLKPIQLGVDADNICLDPEAGEMVAGCGDGALALIDAAFGKLTWAAGYSSPGRMRSKIGQSRGR